MRYPALLLLALLCAKPAAAFELTTDVVAGALYVTSQITSLPFQNKIVRDARDDAAVFVASDGAQRGARLEAALHWLREQDPQLTASDSELAQAILVQ